MIEKWINSSSIKGFHRESYKMSNYVFALLDQYNVNNQKSEINKIEKT